MYTFCSVRDVMGEHWTGSPNKNTTKQANIAQKMSENCVFMKVPPDNLRTFFRHFSDILSTFRLSGPPNDLPVTTLEDRKQQDRK